MKTSVLIAILLACHASIPARSAESGPASPCRGIPVLPMKTVRVALFKNDCGFVTMRGKLGEGRQFDLKSLPKPVLGTFWFGATGGAEIQSILSRLVVQSDDAPVGSFASLAAANPGAEVVLRLKSGESVTGRINPNGTRELILLNHAQDGKMPDAPTGTVAFNVGEIARMRFVDEKIALPKQKKATLSTLLKLKEPAPGAIAEVTCLTKGISWLPSYKIEIGPNGKAELQAKASITNTGAEDWENVEVELITGFPYLQYENQIDPMALDALQKSVVRRDDNSGYMTQTVDSGSFMGYASSSSPREEKIDGTQTEDLFFYPLGNVNLAANGVLTVPLFSHTFDCAHIYTWDVPDPAHEPANRRNDRNEEDAEIPPVWHCIRMKNTLKSPLTTAPVELIAKGRIAGQSTVNYTPSGADCTVKVNRTANLIPERGLKLLSRERHVNSRESSTYKTRNQISLTLTNYTGKEVVVEIKQKIRGEIETMSDNGSAASRVNIHDLDNPDSEAFWTLSLKPGEKKTVTATYVYIGDRW